LLEGLHEDLNRIHVKPEYEEIKDDPTMNEKEKCAVWWNNYEERNNSSIKGKYKMRFLFFLSLSNPFH
jgi:hypothetical protein